MCAIYTVLVEYEESQKSNAFKTRAGFRRTETDSDTRDRLVVGSRLCVEGAPEEEAQQHPTGGSGPCRYLITLEVVPCFIITSQSCFKLKISTL